MKNERPTHSRPLSVLDKAGEATDIAKMAFANGELVHGIAALQLGAQLIQLAKLQERMKL